MQQAPRAVSHLPRWLREDVTPPEGQFSPSAGLFWGPGEDSIRSLFHDPENFDEALLCGFAASYLILACLTYGLGVPSGLFVPALLAGAAIGRAFGQVLQPRVPASVAAPGAYALVGATALLAGVARVTISLAVILMEASPAVIFAQPSR